VDISIVAMICFFAISSVCIAVYMIFRDLFLAGSGGSGMGVSSALVPKELRRKASVFDEAPAQNFTGKIDQAFDRLILESGIDASPTTAFLMILAIALLISSTLFLYLNDPLWGILGACFGLPTPLFVFGIYRYRRLKELKDNMPYLLDLLSRAVRAGESIDQAVQLVGEETKGALGKEFTRCSQQMEMGLSLSAVMKSLSKRVRLVEIRMLSTALIVHRQTGGNLARTLERMSDVVRDRLNYHRQMKASTGAGRASTLLIAILSPIVYVVMFAWHPDHVGILWDDPIGKIMLLAAAILEITGILWVTHMLRNDY